MSQRKEENRSPQDVVSNKILILVTVAFAAVFALMFLYRGLNTLTAYTRTMSIVRILVIVAAVVSVGCLIWYLIRRPRFSEYKLKTITPLNCFFTALGVLIGLLLVQFFGVAAIKVLYAVIPLYVALYFIKCVFSRSAFLVCGFCGVSGVIFYVLFKLLSNIHLAPYAEIVLYLMILLVAALFYGVYFLRKNEGKLKLGDKKIPFLEKGASYWPMFAVALVALAGYGSYFAIGADGLRYGLFAMVACLFLAILYYIFELVVHQKG